MSVVDTNVLVHSRIVASPDHGKARGALARLATDGSISVSRQILREFVSVTTRPERNDVAGQLRAYAASLDRRAAFGGSR